MPESPVLDSLIENVILAAGKEKALYKHLRDLPEHFLMELSENPNIVFKRALDVTTPQIADRIIRAIYVVSGENGPNPEANVKGAVEDEARSGSVQADPAATEDERHQKKISATAKGKASLSYKIKHPPIPEDLRVFLIAKTQLLETPAIRALFHSILSENPEAIEIFQLWENAKQDSIYFDQPEFMDRWGLLEKQYQDFLEVTASADEREQPFIHADVFKIVDWFSEFTPDEGATPNFWILKYNPQTTPKEITAPGDIDSAIRSGSLGWDIRSGKYDIKERDIVFVWRGGREPGFVAWGFAKNVEGKPHPYQLDIPIQFSTLGASGDYLFENKLFEEVGANSADLKFTRKSLHKPGDVTVDAIYKVLKNKGIPLPTRATKDRPIEPPQDTLNDTILTRDDSRALKDELARQPMAETLAIRIHQVWKRISTQDGNDPLAIHLAGRWGSGKSSFFEFLKQALTKTEEGSEIDREWLIVEFNAWEYQHLQPAWWSLYSEVFNQCSRSIRKACFWRGFVVWLKELFWRFFTGRNSRTWFLLIATFGLFIFALIVHLTGGSVLKSVGIVGGVATGILTFFQVTQESLLGGSATAAQNYDRLESDPKTKLKRHIDKMFRRFDHPVLIFIDDIDRCEAEYVVHLLEAIMTVFRSSRIVFMVAGDAKWIETCFETQYKIFSKTTRTPGRHLGHHFLEKVFQFTVPIPELSVEMRDKFFNKLLDASRKSNGEKVGPSIGGEAGEPNTQPELESVVDEMMEQQEELQEEFRAEDTDAETEHFLRRFSTLAEPNPRSMKRLVNSYVAIAMAETARRVGIKLNEVDRCKIALWAIIRQRWPVLEDYLEVRINQIENIAGRKFIPEENDPDGAEIERLLNTQPKIELIFKGFTSGEHEIPPLTAKDIRWFLGLEASPSED